MFWSPSRGAWVWRAIIDRTRKRVIYRSGHARTRQEAVARQREAERIGRIQPASAVTVGEWIDGWLQTVARPTIRVSTYQRYEQVVRLHLRPRLGDIRLAMLTSRTLSRAYGEMIQAGLSPGNVKKISEVLSSAMECAVRDGIIAIAPTASAVIPRVNRPAIEVFSDAEIAAILTAAQGHRLGLLFRLAIGTGMRQGELLALRWEDLSGNAIHVSRTITSDGVGPPKSARGNRVIDLPAFAAISDRKTRGPIFATAVGNPYGKSYIARKVHRPLLAVARVHYRKFHTFRHTHASRLLAAGVDVAEVARRLGDSIETIMRCYAHWMPSGKGTTGILDSIYG